MNRIKIYLTPLLTGLIVLGLSSCASFPTKQQSNNLSSPKAETTKTPSASESDSAASTPSQAQQKTPVGSQPSIATNKKAASTPRSTQTVTLNIYQADSQCQALVPEKVAVPASSPVDAAVGTVLKQVDSGDFELAGYRVKVNQNSGVATVDFRLSPDSRRKFVSLSACEQFALFGSVRKTLTDNSRLKIKDVRFTQQGQEIML
ncbi:MAG TPA: sporulation/spore germination protein [Coleofasciculaceae cyanobacterium]